MNLIRPASSRIVIDGKVLVDDHFSGIGHYAMSLLQAVDQLLDEEPDIDVRLAAPYGRVAQLGRFGFRRIRPLTLPVGYRTLRRLVEQGRMPQVDRLIGRGVYVFPNYVRWPLATSPSITAVHDLSFVKVPQTVDAPNRAYLDRVVRDSVERSDLISVLTATVGDEIVDHYGVDPDRIRVVGCAADTRHFYRRSDREVHEVTTRYGVYGPYVLSVGNIEPRKNQVRLLDAFCSLPRAVTDPYTLVLAGAGAWNREEIDARVEAALDDGHKVRLLLGDVTDADLPALYTGARCSAYVSIYEGFGMPPLESMACRTPVLTSDRSVMPEVAGGAAVLADPYSVASLAEGLGRLLTLDDAARADLIDAGLANVARYRWTDAARALLDATRELGAGPS